MSGPEILELKKELRAIKSEMSDNTKLTRQTLDIVGTRISALEISEARRQGRESVGGSENPNWTKIILAALGVASAAVSLALFIATKVLT